MVRTWDFIRSLSSKFYAFLLQKCIFQTFVLNKVCLGEIILQNFCLKNFVLNQFFLLKTALSYNSIVLKCCCLIKAAPKSYLPRI